MTDWREDKRIAYMCGVDFQHHLGEDAQPTKTYASAEDLKAARTCWPQCGIVEVEISVKSWVVEQDFEAAAAVRARSLDG